MAEEFFIPILGFFIPRALFDTELFLRGNDDFMGVFRGFNARHLANLERSIYPFLLDMVAMLLPPSLAFLL